MWNFTFYNKRENKTYTEYTLCIFLTIDIQIINPIIAYKNYIILKTQHCIIFSTHLRDRICKCSVLSVNRIDSACQENLN